MDYGKTRVIEFDVPGKIHTKNTGKIVKVGGFNKIVQPRESLDYANLIRFYCRQHIKTFDIVNKPVRVDYTAFIYPTKAILNSKKKMALIKDEDYPYCKKPDRDRVDNQLLDALKGLVFRDDTLAYTGTITKFYSLNPRLAIKITIFDELEVI